MAEPKLPEPVMLIVAVFSASADVVGWARENLKNRYGRILLESSAFDFIETHYYDDAMGSGLKKQFLAFEQLIEATDLVEIKLQTNELEQFAALEFAGRMGPTPIARPVNLDPGYLNLGKWVLATTKDQAHRLYLGRGIYAEVTLRFEHGQFVPWPWTYSNYQREDYRSFFKHARSAYLAMRRHPPIGPQETE